MKRISNNKLNINSLKIKFFRNFRKFYKITKEISLILIVLQTIVFSSILISEPKAASLFLNKFYRRILWSFDTLEIEDYGNYIMDFLYVLNPLKKSPISIPPPKVSPNTTTAVHLDPLAIFAASLRIKKLNRL